MPRDSSQYLEDIVEAINRIHTYAAGLDESSFSRDLKTQDAVLHNLGVIGDLRTQNSEPRPAAG